MSVNLRLMKPLTPKWEDLLVRSTRYLLLLCLVCYFVYTDYERAGYIAAVMFGCFPLWAIAAGLGFFFFFFEIVGQDQCQSQRFSPGVSLRLWSIG